MGLILATLERQILRGLLMQETKEKKVRPSKKVLIREIAEQTDLFNFASLERTNIHNLTVIRDLISSKG
tara:strand:- start:694 stop:900 length:207 start_codon:yes stop_codon:yes gene_type:complete